MPDKMDYGKHSPFNFREGEWLASISDLEDINPGQSTMNRMEISTGNTGVTSGQVRLCFFTAVRTELVNRVEISSGTTAAAATPTLVRMGLYTVAANGDLTLVASTANDTSLFAATFTMYNKALVAPYTLIKGQRYAFGILVISGVATPTFYGNASVPIPVQTYPPRLAAFIGSQTDLPSSILNSNLLTTNQTYFAAFFA